MLVGKKQSCVDKQVVTDNNIKFDIEPIKKVKSKKNRFFFAIPFIFIFLLLIVVLPNAFGVLQATPSIELQSENYPNDGSWHIDKSAVWTDKRKAKITFDVNSVAKINNSNYTDIIFVIDISGSMSGSKLKRVKEDAIGLIEVLLSDSNNRAAIITFESTSEIVSGFTNNKTDLINKINNLSAYGCTNYDAGLKNVDEVMNNYVKESNRNLITLFLTDGYPNEDTPNQIAMYNILKNKYPYMVINGVQYEMGMDVIKEIKEVSDNQWVATQDSLNNVLFEAGINPIRYEKFEIVDYIDNNYFIVDSISNIKVNKGEVKLEIENGLQKITWTIDNSVTGFSTKMEIDVMLKDGVIEEYNLTNKKEVITYKLQGENEKVVNSNLTPILYQGNYNVIYDNNSPRECQLPSIQNEQYTIWENVTKKDTHLLCNGWLFKGWQIVESDVKKISDDVFVMPGHDVTIKGLWGKTSIAKAMDGTIYTVKSATFDKGTVFNSKIKTMVAGSNKPEYASDKTVEKILWSNTLPSGFTPTTANTVSSSTSQVPIYAWYDDNLKTVYLYTEAEGKIYLNSDSYRMFGYFYVLSDISMITKVDTSNVRNMSCIFICCSDLTSLDVSNFNTSNVTTMSGMFADCSNLTSLDLSNFNTSNVTIMGGMFSGCSNLTSLDLSNFNTSNVTTMSSMFRDCSSITSLDLSNFNTSNVTTMSNMFDNCSSITSLDVSNFNTSNVTDMSYMFDDCSSITSLDVSNFNTSNVTNMSYMFDDCSSITSLDLSNFNTSNVKNMSNMFDNCSSITSLDVSNFNTSNVTDMSYMFDDCSSITSLDVSNFNTSNVTNMSYMFDDCSSITSLDLSSFDTSNVKNMNYMFHNCSSITSLNISSFDTSSVNKMDSMFRWCSGLTSLDLSSFDTSSVTDMGDMFSYCRGLTSLDLSGFNTSNVTIMYGMFDCCSSLTSLDLSSFNTSNVTTMAYMFSSCSSITSLDLSSFNTINVTTMSDMFADCSSITSLDLSSFDTSSVTDMSYMFYYCNRLSSLNLSSFDTSNVTSMYYMFARSSSLTSLDLGSFNTSSVGNMGDMFYNCSKLTVIYTSSSFVTTQVTYSDGMFERCYNLKGGNGTAYNSSYVDKTYARIDTASTPGYFTAKS